MSIVETQRLVVRSLEASDVPALVSIWGDADVTRYMGGPRDPNKVKRSLEDELASSQSDAVAFWPVIEKTTARVIGDCGLTRKDIDGQSEIELVYVFAKDAWGQGYATEVATALRNYAFDRLGLERLVALIDPANAASERVAFKIGMRHEKDTLRPDGTWRKLYTLARGGLPHQVPPSVRDFHAGFSPRRGVACCVGRVSRTLNIGGGDGPCRNSR